MNISRFSVVSGSGNREDGSEQVGSGDRFLIENSLRGRGVSEEGGGVDWCAGVLATGGGGLSMCLASATDHDALPKNGFGPPTYDTFGGNGHRRRPNQSHSPRPPMLGFEGALYRTFPPPKIAGYSRGTKGRFCKRAVLANVPSFRFLVPSFCFLYPLSGFGTIVPYFCTLVPVFGLRGSSAKPPFWKPPFGEPPRYVLPPPRRRGPGEAS